MADTKKISELNSVSNLANEDEFVVIDKNGTGEDSSSSGKTSKIRFDELKTQIGSQGEKGEKGDANKGEKGEEGDKGLKGEPLEFTDLSSTEKTSLKGAKGEEGDKGLKGEPLEFTDLSPTEKTSLKGAKGEEGDKGLKGEPLEFTDLTSAQKNSLKGAPGQKLTFNDLSATEKTSLKGKKGEVGQKLTFNDLSSTEKTSLKGQKGDANKGQKGEVDAYASAKSLFYWNSNALVGKSTDTIFKTQGASGWNSGVWSKKSYTNGASISFKVGSRMYAKKPIFIIGFTSSSNRSDSSASYFDYGIYYHGVNNKLYAKKGSGNSMDRTLPTNGGTFTLTYDAKNVRMYIDNTLVFTWNTDLNKTFSMKASMYSPTDSVYKVGGTTYRDPLAYDVQFSPFGQTGDKGIKGAPGAAGPNDITNKAITSNATSSWTGNPGSQGKIQYHSNRWYIVSDKASNRIVQFRRDGSDKSYIDNNGKFVGTATSAESAVSAGNSVKLDGLPVTSFVRTNAATSVSASTTWQDSQSIYLGTGSDYRIYHNTNNSTYFQNRNHGAGTYFQSENSAGTSQAHLYLDGGARPFVRLFEYGSERLRTTSTGVKITGNLEVTGGLPFIRTNATSNVSADTEWQDNKSIYLGNSSDYRIYHNSNNHTYFQNRNHGTGTYFQSENSAGTNVGHLYLEGGSRPYVRLLESGQERLRTTSTGVKITGGLEVTGQPQVKAAATIVFRRVQTNLQASESNSFEDIETIDDTSEQYILGGNNDGDDDDDDDYVAPIYRTTLTTNHKIGFKSVTQSGNTAKLTFDTPVADANKITVNLTKGSSINWIPYVSTYDKNSVTVAFPGNNSAWTFPLHISVFY